jgi:hypothetical protein
MAVLFSFEILYIIGFTKFVSHKQINEKINKSLQFNLGGVNDSTALNNHNESKSDRRKRLARERYAAVSPGKRV